MRTPLAIAATAVCLVAAVAALASAGGTSPTHADPAAAGIDACAHARAANYFARLPAGMRAAPLDDLIVGAIEDQVSIPPEARKWLQMREIDAGGRRIGVLAVVPVGSRRAALLNEFVDRAMALGSPPPQDVAGATLVHMSTAYGKISAAMTFSGCRALLVATRDDATTVRIAATVRSQA